MEDYWKYLPALCKEKIIGYVLLDKKLNTYEDVHMLTEMVNDCERERIRKEWVTEKRIEKMVRWRVLHRHLVREE